jgi:predicted TIM-barrel fold metal-dependent hydrolase
MEVDVAEADIESETALVGEIGDPVIGAIAACRPENPDFEFFLERVASNPKVRGFRRVLHTGAYEYAGSDEFKRNIRFLARTGHPFDFCVWPRHIPLAYSIAKACPEIQFVLDHCGMPDIKGGDFPLWNEHISEFARLPNVACKVSGIIAYADPNGKMVDHLRPYVEHSIISFGWDRVVWGSDWPVCNKTASLTRWVEVTHELLCGTSESEKEKMLSRNACRIYRLNEAALPGI